jgi:hypothetical protein
MSAEGDLFFLEANTRIQVEHPITELVTGLDLVEMQLKIGSDVPVEDVLSEVKPKGHAMEFRINAENPFNNFLPAPGRIEKYVERPATMCARGLPRIRGLCWCPRCSTTCWPSSSSPAGPGTMVLNRSQDALEPLHVTGIKDHHTVSSSGGPQSRISRRQLQHRLLQGHTSRRTC